MTQRSVILSFGDVVDQTFLGEHGETLHVEREVVVSVAESINTARITTIDGREALSLGGSPVDPIEVVGDEERWSPERVAAAYVLRLARGSSPEVAEEQYQQMLAIGREEAQHGPVEYVWQDINR